MIDRPCIDYNISFSVINIWQNIFFKEGFLLFLYSIKYVDRDITKKIKNIYHIKVSLKNIKNLIIKKQLYTIKKTQFSYTTL